MQVEQKQSLVVRACFRTCGREDRMAAVIWRSRDLGKCLTLRGKQALLAYEITTFSHVFTCPGCFLGFSSIRRNQTKLSIRFRIFKSCPSSPSIFSAACIFSSNYRHTIFRIAWELNFDIVQNQRQSIAEFDSRVTNHPCSSIPRRCRANLCSRQLQVR